MAVSSSGVSTHYDSLAARSSDPSRALRDELLALASLAAGVAGASTNVLAAGTITPLDEYALEQAVQYFQRRADEMRHGRTLTSMAAMGAAREVATLHWPEMRNRNGAEILKLYEDLGEKLRTLLSKGPQRKDIAKEFQPLFSSLAETARAEARGLVYDNLESEEEGR